MDAFRRYAALLVEWQSRMNLVGSATLPNLWSRHFRDSAQLVPLASGPPGRIWLDLGSGAGFPGLVAALLTDAGVHLVESTTKKCNFLQAVADACNITNLTIHNARIESLTPFPAAIITTRAFAPLTRIFDSARKFSTPKTLWLLPKGARHEDEINQAKQYFDFDFELVRSRTSLDARILVAKLHMRDDR